MDVVIAILAVVLPIGLAVVAFRPAPRRRRGGNWAGGHFGNATPTSGFMSWWAGGDGGSSWGGGGDCGLSDGGGGFHGGDGGGHGGHC